MHGNAPLFIVIANVIEADTLGPFAARYSFFHTGQSSKKKPATCAGFSVAFTEICLAGLTAAAFAFLVVSFTTGTFAATAFAFFVMAFTTGTFAATAFAFFVMAFTTRTFAAATFAI